MQSSMGLLKFRWISAHIYQTTWCHVPEDIFTVIKARNSDLSDFLFSVQLGNFAVFYLQIINMLFYHPQFSLEKHISDLFETKKACNTLQRFSLECCKLAAVGLHNDKCN
jgi:hypothetical protein